MVFSQPADATANGLKTKLKLASHISNNTVPLVVGGRELAGSQVFSIVNATNGQELWKAGGATVDEAIQAVNAAEAAFPSWSKTKPAYRRDIFLRASELFREHYDELADYQRLETAADPKFVQIMLDLAIDNLKEVAGETSLITGSFQSSSDEGRSAIVLKEPYGVILGIAPWNAPWPLGCRAFSHAIAAGNTCVIKAPELAPRCFHSIVSILREAGLPDGVLNLVFHRAQDAAAVTESLIAHPAVKKINFTGSTAVGSILASMAGKHLKPIITELGGKASAIILADADLEKAAFQCTIGAFLHAGQVCMKTERIIVHKSVADSFISVFKKTTSELYGSNSTRLVNSAGAKKTKRLVKAAIDGGAEVLLGDAAESLKPDESNGMRPIILAKVPKGNDLHEIESFGPTAVIYTFETENEALAIANDTISGLTGAVFTRDLAAGLRIARGYETGAVHINAMTIHDESNLPHGGTKSSGWGRFNGIPGLNEYLRTKIVTFDE